MKTLLITISAALLPALGCAGNYPPPTQQMADVESANRSASELGAQNNPKAQLHLKLAEEQLQQAKTAMAKEDNKGAESLLMRAKADAELAVALTRARQRDERSGQGGRPIERATLHQQRHKERHNENLKSLSKTGLLLALAGSGCATAAPPRRTADRTRVLRHAQSRARRRKYDPADLHTAHKALQASEKSYLDERRHAARPGTWRTPPTGAPRSPRRAPTPRSRRETQQKTVSDMHSAETTQLKATSAQLGQANQQLASKDQQIATENEARAAAEKRAAQAAADLAKFASVKQEARGMVITLSGGVLFASAKSDLLPEAQVKLNSVADALTQQDPDSKMVVEGHTDSQGGVSYNQDLSQRRAQTVRDYLVSRGIAADRVTSQGFGSSRSIADNKSAEGRANNRRVEIVVAPTAAAGGLSQR